MKNSCYGCRALSAMGTCYLGYEVNKIERHVRGLGIVYRPEPQEECPKPRSYKSYLKLKRMKDKKEG